MMSDFDKAVDLYLRGFKGDVIKDQTGISLQSMLKQLLSNGVKYTKDDIVDYQVSYICKRYTYDDLVTSYIQMSETFDDVYKVARGKNINMLGCAFGDYKKVYIAIMGKANYDNLRNDCWLKKQQKTVESLYGVTNVFQKETFKTFVSDDAVANGRRKRTETLLSRYGVEHPNMDDDIKSKMIDSLIETNIHKYGVENPMQNPEIANKSAKNRQKTMFAKYGASNSTQIPHIRNKIFESRRRNKTLNTSRPEKQLGELLIDMFGEDDVLHNVIVDERYPFHVDYYIKSRDLFIELNGDRSHNTHWFDETSDADMNQLKHWQKRMCEIEQHWNRPSRYRQFINVWTKTDVQKRNIAKSNSLNYLVFWDSRMVMRNGVLIPRLRDFHLWVDRGCPNPQEWLPENTY